MIDLEGFMTVIGYARISTTVQELEVEIEAIEKRIYQKKATIKGRKSHLLTNLPFDWPGGVAGKRSEGRVKVE